MAITSAVCNSFKVEILTAIHDFTASTGVKFSPTLPPIVPRIPDIDFIKVMFVFFIITNIQFETLFINSLLYNIY